MLIAPYDTHAFAEECRPLWYLRGSAIYISTMTERKSGWSRDLWVWDKPEQKVNVIKKLFTKVQDGKMKTVRPLVEVEDI